MPSSLKLPASLVGALRSHQQEAIHFIWGRLVDNGFVSMAARSHASSLEQRAILYHEVYGCILGHSMGLGKTLTAIAFLLLLQAHVFLMALKRLQVRGPSRELFAPNLRVLVLCPKSCVGHWQGSLSDWIRPDIFGRVTLPVLVPSTVSNQSAVESMVYRFYAEGGILVMSYEGYLRLTANATQKYRDSTQVPRVWSVMDHVRQKLPLSPKVRLLDMLEIADVVVLDEAHRLRKSTAKLVQGLRQHLRNTQLRLALTGTPLQNHLEEYNVMQSIVTGSSLDSHQFQKLFVHPIEVGQCADSSFQQFLEMQKCVASLRRFFAATVHHCGPEVLEQMLPSRREFVFFVHLSAEQETLYKQMVARFAALYSAKERGAAALVLHHHSTRICLHPCLAALNVDPKHRAASGEPDDDKSDSSGESEEEEDAPAVNTFFLDLSLSPKLMFAVALIARILDTGEKVVVFSHYVAHLKLMQDVMRQCFRMGVSIFSGECSDVERQLSLDAFQRDPNQRVLLCSVRSGGVGINACAANHCILLDVGWNPSDDTQATYRVYRMGQTRPVTIYRIATIGTSEQIVFSYALRKSWLHKKLLDVSDPTRQERHERKSYFVYPCSVPVRDDAPSVEESTPPEEARRLKIEYILKVCRQHCAPVAYIIEANPALADTVATVVQHSFLLRDNDEEVITEMGKRFEAQRKKEASIPIALYRQAPTRPDETACGLTSRCEEKLVDIARQAANHVVAHVMQHWNEDRVDCAGEESETRAIAREASGMIDEVLRQLLPEGVRGKPTTITETLLYTYHEGVATVMAEYLNTPTFAKLRSSLMSRIPAMSRRSTLMEGALEDTLKYRPHQLLEGMSGAEQSYTATELGLLRPLVPGCFLLGLQRLLCCPDITHVSVEGVTRLAKLFHVAGCADDEDADEGGKTSCGPAGDGGTSLLFGADAVEALLGRLGESLEACFNDLWPEEANLVLPSMAVSVAEEEKMAQRVAEGSAQPHPTGLYTLSEVAAHLHLQVYNRQLGSYTCPRCGETFLRRVSPVVMGCSRCHYNAEFEISSELRCQQHTTLYQLAVTCNLLDAVSTSKSFSTAFTPAKCTSTWQALNQLRSAQSVYHFVDHCMEEGVGVLLAEFPRKCVKLLGIQSGVGSDTTLLSKLLHTNARMVWGRGLRPHLRERLSQCFQDLVMPCRLATLAAMPLMCIVMALHVTARREGINVAGQLKTPDAPLPTSRRCELLGFVCDGLVKLLYVEKVLQHDKPVAAKLQPSDSPTGSAQSVSLPSLPSSPAVSLKDLIWTASSSESPSLPQRTPSPPRKTERFASKRGRSPGSTSSSSTSSYALCYSSDRASFSEGEPDAGDPTTTANPEQLEEEQVLSHRSAWYWVAYCKVYGTKSAERLTVFVEDEEEGMTMLPPPPTYLWTSHLSKASTYGMPIGDAIDLFLDKVLSLSKQVRLIQ